MNISKIKVNLLDKSLSNFQYFADTRSRERLLVPALTQQAPPYLVDDHLVVICKGWPEEAVEAVWFGDILNDFYKKRT